MKYEFIKVDEDTTKLKYGEKEFDIKKTVGLLQKLQSLNNKAKLTMYKELKESGLTANDLIVTKTEGNKTTEDKSSLIELEQYYVGVESQKVYDEILKEATGMTLAEILVDMNLDFNNTDTVKDFMVELTKAITTVGKSPSEEKQN